MPRALRLRIPEGVYHVTVRGNNREAIFADDADYQRYLQEVRRCHDEHGCHLLAYALMTNHVHLVLRDHEASLSRYMQVLNARYTRYFNRRYARVGHLYQGRFFARLVDRDAYLLEVTRYVHLNPVRAGLVERPAQYRWSSYRHYAGVEEMSRSMIDAALVCSMLGGEGREPHLRYRRFVEGMTRQKFPVWEYRLRRLGLIGSVRFARHMLSASPGVSDT